MMNTPISPDELQMLSAYLDGQLTPAETRQAQKLLDSQPELRAALEDLRQTRALLRSLPMRRAPRNFTLSASAVPKRRAQPLAVFMRWSSAFATAAAVVVLALGQLSGLLFNGAKAPMPAAAPVMESYSAAESQTADNLQATVPVIVWGEVPQTAYGKGGAEGMGGGGDGNVASQPAYPAATAAPAAAAMAPQPTPTPAAEVPAAVEGSAPTVEAPAPEDQVSKMGVNPEPTASAAVTPAPTVPLDQSNPILGVAPAEEQGLEKAAPAERSMAETQPPAAPSNTWSFYVAGALLALAVATGLAGFLLGRK